MNSATVPSYALVLFFIVNLHHALPMAAQNMQVANANSGLFTPQSLISTIFLGDGVELVNISYTGEPKAVGYFTNGQMAVGLGRGIVMSSGLTETADPLLAQYGSTENGKLFGNTNLLGYIPGADPDLSLLATNLLYDISSFVITFIPSSDTLRFRYCFASEEYPEYGCSGYNDIFGFFIQGPNYPSQTNLALIPGSNLPVSINNIHPDNTTLSQFCPPKNAQYYIDNNGTNTPPIYDGLTQVFVAEAIVVPCQTYTIKLVLADVGDPNYDSGVFLEAKSFGTGAVQAELLTPGFDGAITEGCAEGTLTFRLSGPATADFPLDYKISGTASNGIDYQSIPTGLFIPAGTQEISIPIRAFEDNLAESVEFLAIDFQRNPCRRDTIRVFIRGNTLAAPDQLKDTIYCQGTAAPVLLGSLPVVLPAPQSFSNPLDFSIAPEDSAITSSVNVFGVQPASLKSGMIRSVCLNVAHAWADDLDVYLISPGGQFLELFTDCGANGKNFTNTCFSPSASRSIGQATAFDAPFTGDWQPEGVWSDLWSTGSSPTNGNWQLQLKDDQNGFVGILTDWTITFEPLYEINYRWSPVSGLDCPDCPNTLAQPDTSTTYLLEAVDSYGCSLSDSAYIQVYQPLIAPGIDCSAFTDSTLTVAWTAVPGASGYLVNVNGSGWSSPSGFLEHQISSLGPNALVSIELQILGDSSSPCPISIATASCANCVQPLVALSITNESCAGFADGAVTMIPDGNDPPYSFQFGTQTNASGVFDNLSAGTYSAVVTDNSGCQTVLPVTIQAAAAILVNISPTHVSCYGGSNGAALAVGTGGIGPYNFQWSDPANQTQAKAVNLRSGTYTVTATDAHGCTALASATLLEPGAISLNVTTNPVKCFGDSSGWATVSGTGGVGPYSYIWSTGQTGPVASSLKAGSYPVTLTDAAGCTKTSIASIDEPPVLAATISNTAANCSNQATVYVSGGSSPYQLLWSSGEVSPQITNKAAGSYTVTITDQQGCTATQTTVLAGGQNIDVRIVQKSEPICFNGSDGWIIVAGQNGLAPYSYSWGLPVVQFVDSLATQLGAGSFPVTVTDANGCSSSLTATLGQPAAPSIQFDIRPVSCFDGKTGSVRAIPSNANPSYQYLWSTGDLTPGIQNLSAGAYQLTLTDPSGCSFVKSVEIGQPDSPLSGTVIKTDAACFGSHSGSIRIQGSGGALPYRYALDNADWNGSSLQFKLAAGSYIPRIQDKNGCSTSLPAVEIQQHAPVLLDLGGPVTIGYGESAQLSATIDHANGGIDFFWNPADSLWLSCLNCPDPIVSNLEFAHWFELMVVDSLGCTAVNRVQVIVEKHRKVFVPTGFSPNGDGANDRLLAHGQSTTRVLSFEVFDRWGELVYAESGFYLNDPNAGWDGAIRGSPANPGLFIWVLEVEYPDGVQEVYRGSATLIR